MPNDQLLIVWVQKSFSTKFGINSTKYKLCDRFDSYPIFVVILKKMLFLKNIYFFGPFLIRNVQKILHFDGVIIEKRKNNLISQLFIHLFIIF